MEPEVFADRYPTESSHQCDTEIYTYVHSAFVALLVPYKLEFELEVELTQMAWRLSLVQLQVGCTMGTWSFLQQFEAQLPIVFLTSPSQLIRASPRTL